ncbi:MAG: hypothetical protein ACOCW7_03795 [Bacteroidota bacterium]
MKNTSFKLPFWVIIFLFSFSACQDDSINPTEPINTELSEHQAFLKEVSILLGKAISDPNDRVELKSWMEKADTDGQLVSFAFLLGDVDNFKINEIESHTKSSDFSYSKPSFLKKMEEVFNDNEAEFLQLYKSARKEEETFQNLKSLDSRELFDYLTSLLVSDQYQIFYPFDPEFEDDDLSIPFFYTSFDPMNGADRNDGFLFLDGSENYETIADMRNDFLDENPVFLVVPIDPCDIPGEPCNSVLLRTMDEIIDYPSYPGEPSDPSNPSDPGGGLPPPSNGEAVLLTYNVNHNHMTDDVDMITTRVGKIRVNGTSWMGFGATFQKLQFMRGAGEGEITISPGQIVAEGIPFTVGSEVRIKRRNVRKKNWVVANLNFDADWTMTKNSQSFAVFSKHNFVFSEAKVTAGYKSGFKLNATGGVEAYHESSGSGTVDIKLNASKFRANVELSRRQVLITIRGAHSTETYEDEGIDYNVKDVGIVDFYFKHWHTSFAD